MQLASFTINKVKRVNCTTHSSNIMVIQRTVITRNVILKLKSVLKVETEVKLKGAYFQNTFT